MSDLFNKHHAGILATHRSLYDEMARSHPSLMQGRVYCARCGRVRTEMPARRLAEMLQRNDGAQGQATMTARKRRQLRLSVRLFLVRADGFAELQIQAATAPAAKYRVFKLAREAGYFRDRGGFRDFLSRGFSAREVRR